MSIQELYKLYLQYSKVSTDSRKSISDSIFFALKGKKFNGNKFAEQAINNGCVYAIVDEKKYAKNEKFILVDNVLVTLQELAKQHRKQLKIPVIAITGTNGKTTSKELIGSVLKTKYKISNTKWNLNNHIGVPLSLLRIKKDDEIAIIEMGANHIEEIGFLCKLAMPNLGIITNIGKAHLEGFGSFQGVIKAKSELYNYIRENGGNIFINMDDELLYKLSDGITKISYGKTGDCKGNVLKISPFISILFRDETINSNLIGDYQFNNIMLAICVGNYFDISTKNIKDAIENYLPRNNRSQIIKTNNNTLILDAYNANPSSMKAMLTSFAKLKYENKLCILGDMLELGKDSALEHTRIFKLAEELNLKTLFIGDEFSKLSINSYKNTKEFTKLIEKEPIQNKTILLKGSRGVALERLVAVL